MKILESLQYIWKMFANIKLNLFNRFLKRGRVQKNLLQFREC